MKALKLSFLSLCFILVSSLCLGQKMVWKQQSDFHTVMSQTFHPAEEGNFLPIKSRSGELVMAAKNWKNSTIPAGVADPSGVKLNLKKLLKDSKYLDKKIRRGTADEVLNKDLTALHDTFHTIVGMCNSKDEHEKH